MNCQRWTQEILEGSRRGAGPSDALSMHLAECPRCAARWESQTELTRHLGRMRAAVSPLRSPGDARLRLLAAFDRKREAEQTRPRWVWGAVAAAAVLALTLSLSRTPALHSRPARPSPDAVEEMALDNEFVPVPYAPPLAQGEVVEVVRMDLSPDALARLGFITQAGYPSEITAELAIGEDGLPRAVRLPESVEISN